jgi:hypothetical protein
MEPLTWAAVLILVATKATEKIGEQVGEKAIAAANRLLNALRHRAPDTVLKLEAATDSAVINVEIIEEEVNQVAAVYPDVQKAVEETAAAAAASGLTSSSLTKLADKLGAVHFGSGNIEINIDKF